MSSLVHAMSRRILIFFFLVAGCTHTTTVDSFVVPEEAMHLGETDLTSLLAAVEQIRFAGEADFRAGRFAIASREYQAIEVVPGTRARFEADVRWVNELTDEGLRMTPTVRSFALTFSRPIVLIGRPPVSRRVSLEGAALQEGSERELSIDIRMGRTLVGSIAQAVMGVPGGLDAVPDALAMIGRIEVGEVSTRLRAGAVLRDGDHELHVMQGSDLRLTRIEVDVPDQSARLDLDGSLILGPGTRLRTPLGELSFEHAQLELHGDFTRRREGTGSAERLRLTQVDRPSRLVAEDGTLTGPGGAVLEIPRLAVRMARSDCGGASLGDTCAMDIRLDLRTGAGSVSVQGVDVAFAQMQVDGAAIQAEGEVRQLIANEVALSEARVELGEGDEVVSLRFADLALRDVRASEAAALQLASGQVVARDGEVRLSLGGVDVVGALAGETVLDLRQRSDAGEIEIGVDAAVEEARLEFGDATLASARGVSITGSFSPQSAEVALRVREDVRIDPSAVSELAIADVRLGFRALRVVREEGVMRLRTEGLRLALPREELLALVRPALPPVFIGEEETLDPSTQATLSRLGGVVLSRDLRRFRTQLMVAGFDELELDVDRGRLSMSGDLAVALQVLADEHEVELAACSHQVSGEVPVPCFEDGLPAVCTRVVSVDVPYPCTEDRSTVAEVFSGALTVGIDVSGGMESNAPATLADLELTAGLRRCDRIAVGGIDPALARLVDVRGMVCERLRGLERTLAVSSLIDMENSPLLAGARVERLRIDSDDAEVRLELELDVSLNP